MTCSYHLKRVLCTAAFLILTLSLASQNFEWINGSSGKATANGVDSDERGYNYIVGSYHADATQDFQLNGTNHITPYYNSGGQNQYEGYLAQYGAMSGEPKKIVTIFPLATGSGGCTQSSQDYVSAKRVVVDRWGSIHVIGVFRGCGINAVDTTGTTVFTMPAANPQAQNVFVITYDSSTFSPVRGFLYQTGVEGFAGDIEVTWDKHKLFVAANFIGDEITVDSFPQSVPYTPVLGVNYFPIVGQDFEILVSQIENDPVAADYGKLETGMTYGGSGNDFAYALASGGGPGGRDLQMAGAFTDSIFTSADVSANALYATAGLDAFACYFLGSLNNLTAVAMHSPGNAEAWALSDSGNIAGGYYEQSITYPNSNSANATAAQDGFMVKIDWNAPTSLWNTEFNDPDYVIVEEIANGACEDVYVSTSQGAHTRRESNFWVIPLMSLPTTTTSERYYASLHKYHDQYTTFNHEWSYQFMQPAQQTGFNNTINSTIINDLEFNDIGSHANNFGDVTFVGRFGDTVAMNLALGGGSLGYGGQAWGLSQDTASMFLGVVDEFPLLDTDSLTLCLTDTADTVPNTLDYNPLFGATYNMGQFSSNFSIIDPPNHPGIVDSVNGWFSPTAAGVGSYVVWNSYRYFGCAAADTATLVSVVEKSFPRQPLTSGTSLAEGLGAEGWPAAENGLGYDLYYLAGTYEGTIQFEKSDGTFITFTSPAGVPSGYIVAYDGCGALWANNFEGDGAGAYIEGLSLPDSHNLFACGAAEGPLTITNSNGEPVPTASTNITPITLTSYGVEKGLVCKIDPLTGEVHWIYLGGDPLAQTNRFHDVANPNDFIVIVTGEFSGTLSGSFGSTTSNGGEDVIMLMLDTNGFDFTGHSFGTAADDHGDAIDGTFIFSDSYLAITGYCNPGTISSTSAFTTVRGSLTIPGGNGQDVFTAMYNFDLSQWLLTPSVIAVYNSPDDDFSHDVRLVRQSDLSTFGQNQVFIAGSFQNQLVTNAVGTLNASSGTDVDAFIGALDFGLTDQWFTEEGSGQPIESANALAIHKGLVYALGRFQSTVNNSVHHTSTTTTSPSMLSGQFAGGVSRTSLFTNRFSPDGLTVFSTQTALAGGPGPNQANDLATLDTSLVNSGSMVMTGTPTLDFQIPGQSPLTQASNTSDAFLARLRAANNAYFKAIPRAQAGAGEATGLRLYPNPNAGTFALVFSKETTGRLRIFSTAGQLVHEQGVHNARQLALPLQLPAGIYVLQVETSSETQHLAFTVH